jgi:CBS domain-containing protein
MGLQENFQKERVSRLGLRKPVTVEPATTMRDALTEMRERELGCAIVVDSGRRPIGIFTESMLIELLPGSGVRYDEPVENYMTREFPTVKVSDPIADVLDIMQRQGIRLLCVVDDQGRVAGLTGQRGLMEYVTDHFPGQVMVQRIGQPPSYCTREGA